MQDFSCNFLLYVISYIVLAALFFMPGSSSGLGHQVPRLPECRHRLGV